jgi:hypothetical protein
MTLKEIVERVEAIDWLHKEAVPDRWPPRAHELDARARFGSTRETVVRLIDLKCDSWQDHRTHRSIV